MYYKNNIQSIQRLFFFFLFTFRLPRHCILSGKLSVKLYQQISEILELEYFRKPESTIPPISNRLY